MIMDNIMMMMDDDDDGQCYYYDDKDEGSDSSSDDSIELEEPLRRAIRRGMSEKEILELIQLNPIALQQKNRYGQYPLHLACENMNMNHVMMKLMELYPIAAHKSTVIRLDYPLHIALSKYDASDNIVMKLIELYPDALKQGNIDHLYPLNIALKYRRSENVVLKLIEFSNGC